MADISRIGGASTMPAAEEDWWEEYSNIVALTAWMAAHEYRPEEIAYAVEKPWKFVEEHLMSKDDENV